MTPGSERIDDETWFLHVKLRTHAPITSGAGALAVMTALSQWGDARGFAIAACFFVVCFVTNVSFDHIVAKHVGMAGELYRTAANNVVFLVVFWALHYPTVGWFWLVFSALTLDVASARQSVVVLSTVVLAHAVSAGLHGVNPALPLSFGALGFVAWNITRARAEATRATLLSVQAQRDALAAEHAARERAEVELRQAQKLEAIGRLAAGVAHEINTPMQFVSDSLEFVTGGATDLLALADACATPEQAERADLSYLAENMPSALANAQEGVRRVAAIVRSMKAFSHPGGDDNANLDLNAAIHNALTIATHEYKLVADVTTQLAELPDVHGNAGDLNQVLLNIIVNAAHAIGDRHAETGERGKIFISSAATTRHVEIRIRDTGGGIAPNIQSKVFEPFFTTKQVGRGTGQGLAIARSVVERHGGELTFLSEPGVGTTFFIRLPLTAPGEIAIAA